MQGIIYYLCGYVRLLLSGNFVQRFLNLCIASGIEIWDIQFRTDGYEVSIYLRDLYKIKPLLHKTNTRIVLLKRYGLPFFIRKWKKRKGFLIGMLLCFLLLKILSGFIWDIELIGGGRLTKELLLQYLSDNGVTYGRKIKEIDLDLEERKLRDHYPFVVWTSFKIEGTRLLVYVKENNQYSVEKNPGITANNYDNLSKPVSIIATFDGRVNSIITRCGLPFVKAGDDVKKGDILVSGELPIMNDDQTVRYYLPVHSDADIEISTVFHYQNKMNYQYEKKNYSGKSRTILYFKIYKQSFCLGVLPDYENYDVTTDMKQVKLINDFYIPVYYGRIKYKDYNLEKFIYSQKECKTLLNTNFQNFCESLHQKGIQIQSKDVKIKKNGQSMMLDSQINVIVHGGEKKEIQLNAENAQTQIKEQ